MAKFKLKKYIGKICIVIWKDAKSDLSTNLRDFLKEGFVINESIGRLRYYDKKGLILANERSCFSDTEDLTLIPLDWVINIFMVKVTTNVEKFISRYFPEHYI